MRAQIVVLMLRVCIYAMHGKTVFVVIEHVVVADDVGVQVDVDCVYTVVECGQYCGGSNYLLLIMMCVLLLIMCVIGLRV